MKRRFAILTAALALLTFLAVPMGMWGQTRTNQTAFYGFETGDAGWTATTFVTNNTAVTAHGGSKYGATNGTTASVQYNDIVASPQSLTCYYTKTTTNNNANSKFHIQVSSNNSTWTTVASGLGMDQVTKGTWYELTADLSSYSDVYVRVRYDGTTGVRALDDITLIYDDGLVPSTDPEITFTPTSITLDEVMVGNEISTTFSVAQANLTSGITLSVDNGSLSTSSIAQGAAATTVTWTYTPTTAGAISATVTATSGTTTETLAISGTAIAPMEGYDVDFEYATDMYPNWTFDNMTTCQTGSITAHGGTYYGTTGGKTTASITTTSTVANPGTLTCYVSKQSGNTTSSTWYIQVSENGSTWTDVKTQSATSMSQGSWIEFTANLTDYTDVYVRVYYSGSTAIRNIDDLTLTTVEPSPAVVTTTTINVPQNFNTDIYQGTNAGTLTATVKDNDDNAISGATVIWSSSNTGVATIDANGAVTLVAVGTTTITASYAGVEDIYRPSSATYELTVTNSAPAMLPFVWQGGSSAAFLALNGVSAQGLGGDYAETHAPYLIKLDGTGDYIQVKCDQRPGKVTIGVEMLGGANTSTITIQGSADGETFTDIEELTISGEQYDVLTLETTNAFAATDRYVRMLFTKGSNVGVGPITIAKLYPLTITGYGTGTGNWYLIASPIGDVAPTNVTNMLSNSYDLYYFDQDTDGYGNEWINYKGDANTNTEIGSFGLEIGKGYLYANSEDVDLIFIGRCPVTESTYKVTLKKTNGVRFAGWNLVGNPYADIAYFTDNRDFYTMNSTATAFELVGAEDARHIQAMEGVFVTAEEDNEEVVFTTTAPGKKGNRLALNLNQGNNVIDRAFIRFGECRQMPKLQFNQNSTKVYIPMDDEDYAVVRAEEMGEMPVNFKAESNGTYSLNFGMDNVEFAYLHLIDNLTGNEVDLLQTPSYSFEAKTTDYESRFKLVFATGNNSNDDNFAYFSNGSFVINNEGNATLQVIDITGRIVKCESINGCTNVNVNAAPGVYMLRLVNGDNVKVQKVVVK